MYTPEQGDIVDLDFDPSAGHEIVKRRPAFVLSQKIFNETTGFAVVAPITSTTQNLRLHVELPAGMKTSGSVLLHQLRSVDYKSRNVSYREASTAQIAKKVQKIAKLILS
ncbi:MAG: mRNA interferase PemK [Nitrospirales bacterium]|nr:MAG: mRNA interferase PemK [Nitrospirales bacterium]